MFQGRDFQSNLMIISLIGIPSNFWMIVSLLVSLLFLSTYVYLTITEEKYFESYHTCIKLLKLRINKINGGLRA